MNTFDGSAMADQFRLPYLDSNVYISAIKGPKTEPPGWAETSTDILQLAEGGHFQVYASTLIEAEVIKAPGEDMLTSEQEAKIQGYLEREFIVWLDVDRVVAREARRLSRTYGFKPADAIHVATALRAECDQLLTWDEKSMHKGGRTIETVFLCEPHYTGFAIAEPLPGME